MYAVVKHEVKEYKGFYPSSGNIDGVYYCKMKKLASDYTKRRFLSDYNKLKNKEIRGEIKNLTMDKDFYKMEYDTCNDGFHVYVYFTIKRGSEILDLPNGPSLKVE